MRNCSWGCNRACSGVEVRSSRVNNLLENVVDAMQLKAGMVGKE